MEKEIQHYLEILFPYCRSITGEANRDTLKVLQEIIPLDILEVDSGTKVFDWEVPLEWNIKSASISDQEGNKLVDFKENNLHLVSYSEPINCEICWEEIKPHLHIHPTIPNAIPYRTTYYKKNWGFCLTHDQYETLSKVKGKLKVNISSSFSEGSLTYGEFILPGKCKKEILISSYICHPSMANDSLSGVILAAFLAREIYKMSERQWSYRFIFIPETIGAITYCNLNNNIIKNIDIGLVLTTVGGPGELGFKQTWDKNHWLNIYVENTLKSFSDNYKIYPFDINGSDERQYSSQNFRVNVATISKDRYYEYPEYHSSLDNLDFVNGDQIKYTLDVYLSLILKIENTRIFINKYPNCEPMLSKHNLYPSIGGAQTFSSSLCKTDLDIILWLLHLCDGLTPIDIIANRLELSLNTLEPFLLLLCDKGLLSEI